MNLPDIIAKAQAIIENEIKPIIELDGGRISLHDIDEQGIAWIKLSGACSTCNASAITLHASVERILRKRIPEINTAKLVHG